jgi:NADPH:quinone reductase
LANVTEWRKEAMKAIQFSQFGGWDVLEYVEVAKPLPQADDLLIEVTASGVNFVDIRERMGVYARPETPGEFLPGLLS